MASSSAKPSLSDVSLLSTTFFMSFTVFAISEAFSLFALNMFISTKKPEERKSIEKRDTDNNENKKNLQLRKKMNMWKLQE